MPIRPRCLAAWLILTLLALALVQPAAAQGGLGSVELSPAPASRSAAPGASVLFRVEARNAHILEQDVAFVASPPAGWAFNFTPSNVTLAPGASGNVTLEVFAPADAAPGSVAAIPLEARTRGTEFTLGRASVNVTVVATPVPPAPEPQPPALDLSAAASSGEPGQTVEGILTLRYEGSTSLEVQLSGTGPAGWNPRFLGGDDFQVLYPGQGPRLVRVYASIPPAFPPNETQPLSLVASAQGFHFVTHWQVVSVAAAPAPDAEAPPTPDPAPPGDAKGTGAVDVVEPASTTSLDARVLDGLLQVAPGGSTLGILRLENTGTTPLKLRLAGQGPTDWAAPVPSRAALDLAPGQVAEVPFTLAAPRDVIPSSAGRGAGAITATAEGGLMRAAPFQIMVVPGAPLDQSPQETPAAALSGEGATSLPLGTFGLAFAFGAVGAGAVALANRPVREKLVWVGIGLYTRLARPDVLGHEDREKLYKLVEQTPGIHFHALQRDLAWNTGTLTYHLRVLEKHGFMVSRRDGLYRRFYLQGAAPRKEVFENAGPSGLRADVLEAIRNQHGMSQTDLSLALGANKQTVNYHVKALERQGLIRLEKKGRETFLYPGNAPVGGAQGEAKA